MSTECVVFLSRGVAEPCRFARFEALLATLGAAREPWLLYNDEPDESALRRLRSLHSGLRLAKQENVTSPAWRAFGGKLINYSKAAFLLWLLNQGSHCTHTWQIEDDVFFTGRWSELFDAHAGEQAHLVALTQSIRPGANWSFEAHCFVVPHVPCRRDGRLLSVIWPLLRISQALAREVSSALSHGAHGFHEAILEPICSRAPWCSTTPLLADHVGRLVGGHIGGLPKSSQTLEMLSLHLHKGWRANASSAALAIPGNKVFHPVKCEADGQLGVKAQRWAKMHTHGRMLLERESAPRAALLLSGHVKDACENGVSPALLRQVALCRAQFAGCDVFIHTWSRLEPSSNESWTNELDKQLEVRGLTALRPRLDALHGDNTGLHEELRKAGVTEASARAWFIAQLRKTATSRPAANSSAPSWPCVETLRARLQPVSIQVEEQQEGQLPDLGHWGHSGTPWIGYIMNVHGMASVQAAMARHAARLGRYDAAVRMRLDLGSPRHRHIGGGIKLDEAGWASVRRRAARCQASDRTMHSCHADKSVGDIAADNCFWSAPASALSSSITALHDVYASLPASDARAASCSRVRHPETLLTCAMRSVGVKPRNMTTARDVHNC